jgi:hypothetical protein
VDAKVTSIAIVGLWCLFDPAPAWAYVDPGAGMVVIQTIGAVIGFLLATASGIVRWIRKRTRIVKDSDAGS